MPPAHIDAIVRLLEDVPSLELRRGDQGVVVSIWLSPSDLRCEVEFTRTGRGRPVRALLRLGQLKVVD